MTTLKFNNKSFNYEKLLKMPSRGVSVDLDVSEAIVDHTLKHLSVEGEREKEGCIVFYLFEGLPIILSGLDLYQKALANSKAKIKGWMFTKHSLATFEMNTKFTITISEPRYNPSFNNSPQWKQPRNDFSNDHHANNDYTETLKAVKTFRNTPAKAFVKRPKSY